MQRNPIKMSWRSRANRQARIAILLGVSSIALAACSAKPPYCPSPVYADPQTKEWLESYEPFPPYVRDYFKGVADEQQAIKDNCK